MQTQGGGPVGWAWGSVSLWGRVIEHEQGWRAQYAYPYALSVESPDDAVATAIRREYLVDVEWTGGELFEKTTARREAAAEAEREAKQAQREEKRALRTELDEIEQRLGEIVQEAERLEGPDGTSQIRPYRPNENFRKWDELMYDTAPVFLAECVEKTMADLGLMAVSAAEVVGWYGREHGLEEARWSSDPQRLGSGLGKAWLAGRVVKVRRKGETGMRYSLPDKRLPADYVVVEDPHAEEDAAALVVFKRAAVTSDRDELHVRDVLPSTATQSEKTVFAHSLSRLVHRGALIEGKRSGSTHTWKIARNKTNVDGPIDPELVLGALSRAINNEDGPAHLRGGVSAGDVGRQLWPEVVMLRNNRPTSALLRVAHVLRKLADEGRVVRLRPRWGSGSNQWTLEGVELGSWITKNWTADAA